MRATLTVAASEGPSKACKVTLKLWDVPRKQLQQVSALCVTREGNLHRRSLLGGNVDVVCDFGDRSLTLVKPSSDVHGLQARFKELVGTSLAHRITATTRDVMRELTATGTATTQEGNMEGYSADELFTTIHHAVRAAAQPVTQPATAKQRTKQKRGRPRAAAA